MIDLSADLEDVFANPRFGPYTHCAECDLPYEARFAGSEAGVCACDHARVRRIWNGGDPEWRQWIEADR